MKKLFIIIFVLIVSLLTGCASNEKKDSDMDMPDDSYSGITSEYDDSMIPSGSLEGYTESYEGYTGSDKADNNDVVINARQLTASARFDNDKYDYWLSLMDTTQEGANIFKEYQNVYQLVTNRIKLSIPNVYNAKVSLYDDDNNITWVSYTDREGVCYLFNNVKKEEYKVNITYTNDQDNVINTDVVVKNDDVIELDSSNVNNIIQLMFIIDTTGSMGDEIRYLQAEIQDVINQVKSLNDNCTIYLSLMFYRDKGDEYVIRYFDFTQDIESQIKNLKKQSVAGGGDFPEAVQSAFSDACKKQWLNTPSTKLIVHVADAPSHNSEVQDWFSSVKKLSELGVRIINVASSGIDKETEFLFRSECIQTNGCYVYLTNHSGIGGSHIDATVEEPEVVEYLNELLIRVICGMHSGTYAEAVPYDKANNQ